MHGEAGRGSLGGQGRESCGSLYEKITAGRRPGSLTGRRPTMSWKIFIRLPAVTFGILGLAGQSTSVTAEESYPWCTQGETLQCYYMTREQCEEAVDYHGFCVANSNVPTLNNEGPQPRLVRPIQSPHYRRR